METRGSEQKNSGVRNKLNLAQQKDQQILHKRESESDFDKPKPAIIQQQLTDVKSSPEKKNDGQSEISKKISQEPSKSNLINPLQLFEDEIITNTTQYLEHLDERMRKSFTSEPQELLRRANAGQDPQWFELLSSNNAARIGLAVVHIDNTYFAARRLVIIHFTVTERGLYEENLRAFTNYIWKNEECDEIKISLYYLEDEQHGKGADKDLQDWMKKLGFKWKQLTQDMNGKRYIDYLLKRPEGVVCEIQKV
jgi:hypothetical protein